MPKIDPNAPTTPAKPANPAAPKLDLSLVKKAEPHYDQIAKANPGVAKFVERNAGAIHVKKSGDVQTSFDWPVWTHSPTSAPGSITAKNETDIIVVWQEVPGSKSEVDFGNGQKYAGEIIALHQVNLRDGKTHRPSMASDKGYLWPDMTVIASGAKGKAAKMTWAVVTLDKDGKATSGGFPSGWEGRHFEAKHGTSESIPLLG
ncbi:MAG: hypothetical protein IT381_08970 [Deltaproteobacteria bacterium]|nr:hypothetical protein [Deltaproteobacteria bacterium]